MTSPFSPTLTNIDICWIPLASQRSLWTAQCKKCLPEQDIVNNLDPWSTPSQVWIESDDFTGIVPSPDSIFVRNWPRAFLKVFYFQWKFTYTSFKYSFQDRIPSIRFYIPIEISQKILMNYFIRKRHSGVKVSKILYMYILVENDILKCG